MTVPLIDDDGLHFAVQKTCPTKTFTKAGLVDIKVEYFAQKPLVPQLRVQYKGPDTGNSFRTVSMPLACTYIYACTHRDTTPFRLGVETVCMYVYVYVCICL
jgi:hypothetical protein